MGRRRAKTSSAAMTCCCSPSFESVEAKETARTGRGRVVRVLVVGPSDSKQELVVAMKEGYHSARSRGASTTPKAFGELARQRTRKEEAAAAAASSGSSPGSLAEILEDDPPKVPQRMLIFNVVPSRDLDQSAQWLAQVPSASAVVVVVDATTPQSSWLDVALRWTESVADLKNMPVALLVDNAQVLADERAIGVVERKQTDYGSFDDDDDDEDDEEDEQRYAVIINSIASSLDAFRAHSALEPVVGCFLRCADDDVSIDGSAACIAALVQTLDRQRAAAALIPDRKTTRGHVDSIDAACGGESCAIL